MALLARFSTRLRNWGQLQLDASLELGAELGSFKLQADAIVQATAERVYELRSRAVKVDTQVCML